MVNEADNVAANTAEVRRLEHRVAELERELAQYRQSEAALNERERAARLIMHNIPNLVGLLKPNGEPDLINQQTRDYTGRTVEELREWGAGDLVHPDDAQQVGEAFVAGIAGGERFMITYRMRRHDGVYRWFEGHHQPLRDEAGQLYRWCVSVIDIDDSMRTRDALRQRERDARAIVDGIPGFVAMLAPNGSVQLVNRRILEYCGETLEGLQGWGQNGIVHLDDMAHVADIFGRSIAAGTPYYIEQRLRRFDGVYRWFGNSGIPVIDDAGQILRWYVLLTDIDEKRRSEDALRASEVDLRLIINTIPGLICLFTPDGQLEGANQQFLDYVLQTAEQANHWATNGTIHVEDLPVTMGEFGHSVRTGEPYDFEARVRRFDGVYRWFQIRGQAHRDAAGRIVRWYGLLTDIEDRKRADDELRRREYYLAAGEHVSLTGSYAWEVSSGAVTCSEQFLRIYEFDDSAQVTIATMRDRIHPDDHPMFEATMAEIRQGRGNPDHELRLLMPDGRIKHGRAFARVVHDPNGQIICIGAVQDVTRRRLAEDALDKVRSDVAQRARVMSLGTLTASIAHELNQPLAGIMTNASTCVRMLTADPPNPTGALETARRIIRDSKRAADVVARLRALFSGKIARKPDVDLNDVASEVLALLASDLQRNRVLVQTRFAQDLPTISADRVQLQQVVLNLVRNACDALTQVDDRQRHAIIETARDGQDRVRLSVRDRGIGFDADNAERLFEAFYTTKHSGMGIGLSLSRSIIEGHQGQLWAEGRDGGGASFSFSLPISTQPALAKE